ncbi:AIPR family protein [Streptomyces sp. SHP 1-2]|uniref:AIPR family protein n=1 Tax=Streptomyces sp. SHP 1-2 TaxID=2769489 RepID=UPI0022384AB6|nr:AIPR family protein [Streptomyces sp. SHP 1-2]MCW5250597.1 AIPR family protein [Streptomyces sp. SHP 1-2]
MTESLEVALQKRVDLDQYESNKRLLFALQLTFDIEDINAVAATALTDAGNDKACDLLYIDRDGGRVILAQGYEAQNTQKLQAPAGKAATLHQAVNWLFSKRQPTGVPETLLGAWRELHDALEADAIGEVEIWYVHNLPESQQVTQEINVASEAAYQMLRQGYPENEVSVSGTELGRTALTRRYENSQAPILVSDIFQINVPGSFEENGQNWTALCTSVPISWLYKRYEEHEADLFSPNVRDYLGSSRSKGNINNGIQETVRNEPANLWAYNNGITALVHDFKIIDANTLEITGLGIVNGAQTTGAIGSVPAGELGEESHVLTRFIRCDDPETVKSIVRFNNRQNPTRASDFRSNDGIQRRLVEEFNKLSVVGYNGGRRGGAEDVIRRPGENQLSAEAAAQALAAFHGASHTAYHEKSKIWEQDEIYSRVFPERVTAEHIVFVTSLMRAIEMEKTKLSRIDSSDRLQDESDLFGWLSLRGSIVLAVEAIGAVHETLIGTAVANPHALRFKKNLSMSKAAETWQPVVESLLAFAPDQLRAPLVTSTALRNRATVDQAVKSFRAQVNSARKHSKSTFETFSQHVQH